MLATPDAVKIQNGYKIRGIAPPDLAAYDPSTRKLFWSWVVEFGLKRKDKELSQGLDKNGKPLRPITAETRKHRRSAMTPSGKGDPSAPPLTPGHQKSRTRSLLAGRAFTTHCEFYWRYDGFTGASWGVVLSYQADEGRDVFGLSDAGLAWVKVQSWALWEQWKRGTLRRPAVAPTAPAPRRFQRQPGESEIVSKGREPTEAATYGIGAEGPRKGHGGRTPAEWDAYFRQQAQAAPPGRPARPASRSVQSGPAYNRMIRHTWGQPRPGSQDSPPPSRPKPGPAVPPTPIAGGGPAKPVKPIPRFGPSRAQIEIKPGHTWSELEEATKKVLGPKATLGDIASIVGATDEATIHLSVITDRPEGPAIYVDTLTDVYETNRVLKIGADGKPYLVAGSFYLDEPYRGKGIYGPKVFGRMVENSAKMGLDRIETTASASGDDNGYFTWPRFGYDAKIPSRVKPRPASLASAKRVSDLMKTEEGRKWWKDYGVTTEMTFDLTPGSQSRKVWEAYLREKQESESRPATSTPKI